MPVRKIPLNRRSVTGLINSQKNQRMMMSESTLERDLLILMEFDLRVDFYEEQPLVINYLDSRGSLRTYTPDLLVHYRQDLQSSKNWGPILIEVKYRRDLFENWKDIKPKIKAGRQFAREKNWDFHILTEREIRTPYLENAKFLIRYRTSEIDWDTANYLLRNLGTKLDSTPQKLIENCSEDMIKRATYLTTLWQLISLGYIKVDIETPLTMNSPIWPVI